MSLYTNKVGIHAQQFIEISYKCVAIDRLNNQENITIHKCTV